MEGPCLVPIGAVGFFGGELDVDGWKNRGIGRFDVEG